MMRDNNEPYDVFNDPDRQTPFWWPVEQRIGYENWLGQTDMWDRYQMGDTAYTMMGISEQDFCAPVRTPVWSGNDSHLRRNHPTGGKALLAERMGCGNADPDGPRW